MVGAAGWINDWEHLDQNPNGDIVVVDAAHSGTRAVQWQMQEDGREYWITQHNVALQPGKRYALVGWYHVDAPGEVALNYIVRGQPGLEPDLSTVPDAPVYPKVVGAWAPFRFELTLPTTPVPQSWDVSVHSIKFNNVAAKLTVDDVRMFEVSPQRAFDHELPRGRR